MVIFHSILHVYQGVAYIFTLAPPALGFPWRHRVALPINGDLRGGKDGDNIGARSSRQAVNDRKRKKKRGKIGTSRSQKMVNSELIT